MISLEKPLIFFDLETTGTNVSTDRIVEIYAKKFLPNGDEQELYHLVNPGVEIPYEATKVHGINNERVAFEPYFEDLKDELYTFFQDSDLGGYNILRFDLPLLAEEFLRIGIDDVFDQSNVVDSMLIFHKMVPRTLAGALMYYKDEEIEDAHSAKADVLATIDVFEAQLQKHTQLPQTTHGIQEFTLNNQDIIDFAGYLKRDMSGDIVFNFGKNKGQKIQDHQDYLQWMLSSDFPAQTKRKIQQLIFKSTHQ